MTTIVFANNELSGDGRATLGDTILSDETVKVYNINNRLVGFAGRYASGLKFLEWFEEFDNANEVQQQVPFVSINIPELMEDEDFTGIVAYPEGYVMLFEGGKAFYEVQAPYVIGSGSDYALGALDQGATAEEAVRVACKRNVLSGGLVTTVTFDEVESDLTKEEALSMSKEDLVAYLYGNDISGEDELTPEQVAFDASESPTLNELADKQTMRIFPQNSRHN